MSDKPIYAKALPESDLRVPCPACTWTIRFQYDGATRLIHECQGCGAKWFLMLTRYKCSMSAASATEKGIFCVCCKANFVDVYAFEAHLSPREEQPGKPAIAYWDVSFDKAKKEALVRSIVAAPKMLGLIKMIYEKLTHEGSTYHDYDLPSEWMEQMKEIIAEVEGAT